MRGVPVLALACGLSWYLVKGDARAGLLVALLVAGAAVLLVLVLPPGRKLSRAEDLYMMAAIFLVFPWIEAKVGYPGRGGRDRPAWHDLRLRYAATGSHDADLEDPRDIVVSRVRSFRIKSYDYKGVAASFTDGGAYLAHTFPLRLLYGPVRVPVNGVWRCRKDPLGSAATTLSIRDVEMEIAIPDEEGRILGWCSRHEIPESVP